MQFRPFGIEVFPGHPNTSSLLALASRSIVVADLTGNPILARRSRSAAQTDARRQYLRLAFDVSYPSLCLVSVMPCLRGRARFGLRIGLDIDDSTTVGALALAFRGREDAALFAKLDSPKLREDHSASPVW